MPSGRRRLSALKPSRPRLDQRISLALLSVVPLAVVRQSSIAYKPVRPKVGDLDLDANLPGIGVCPHGIRNVYPIRRTPHRRICVAIDLNLGNIADAPQVKHHFLGHRPLVAKEELRAICCSAGKIANFRFPALRPRGKAFVFCLCDVARGPRLAERNTPWSDDGDRPLQFLLRTGSVPTRRARAENNEN